MPSGWEWNAASGSSLFRSPITRTVCSKITGTREQAGTAARRYIREWMQRRRRKARLATDQASPSNS